MFFVPRYKPLPFCTTFIPSPIVASLIILGIDGKNSSWIDVAILLSISNDPTGL